MTVRLYYDDAYQTTFESRVVEKRQGKNRLGIVLEETLFYPERGGQPYDLGALNQIPVYAVEEDETSTVVHWIPKDAALLDSNVRGQIDWKRRFDHMQQHTGQHILSQAFVKTLGADTVGFHLSAAYSTIDLNTDTLTSAELAQAELLANQIIFENRPVLTYFADEAQVKTLPLRKPPSVSGAIRIVNIQDFDWSACGGTHVAQTGAVGIIKVVRQEHRGSETRLTFLCGSRALTHYESLHSLTDNLARLFSVGIEDLPASVERLQAQAQAERKQKEEMLQQLLDLEGQALEDKSRAVGSISLVAQLFESRTQDEVRQLARRLIASPGTVALLGTLPPPGSDQTPRKGQLVFARSEDVDHNMRELLQRVCKVTGGGGGGSPELAQGGGIPENMLERALAQAEEWLRS
jgi:alanyl-tRNA synthetase